MRTTCYDVSRQIFVQVPDSYLRVQENCVGKLNHILILLECANRLMYTYIPTLGLVFLPLVTQILLTCRLFLMHVDV